MDPPAKPAEPDNRLSIAFLKCDVLPEASVAALGKYEDVIDDLFRPAMPERFTLEVLAFDAVKRELPTEKELEYLDAIVISGSFEDDAHEDKQVSQAHRTTAAREVADEGNEWIAAER